MKYLIEIQVQIQTEVLSYTYMVEKEEDVDSTIDDCVDSIVGDGCCIEGIQSICVHHVVDTVEQGTDRHIERMRRYDEEERKRELEQQEKNDKRTFERLKKKYEGN